MSVRKVVLTNDVSVQNSIQWKNTHTKNLIYLYCSTMNDFHEKLNEKIPVTSKMYKELTFPEIIP